MLKHKEMNHIKLFVIDGHYSYLYMYVHHSSMPHLKYSCEGSMLLVLAEQIVLYA
jgi:hypothetical protein